MLPSPTVTIILSLLGMVQPSAAAAVCGVKADIAFLMDSSSSISHWDFTKQKKFVQDLVKMFDTRQDRIQVAALTFSDKVVKEFYFNEVAGDQDRIVQKIGGIRHAKGGLTYISKALRVMQTDLFSSNNGARPGALHIGILLTDGEATMKGRAQKQAKMARNAGIKLLAIGIGKVNQDDLKAMVTPPTDEYFFHVDNFNDLTSTTFLDLVEQTACEGGPPEEPSDESPDEPCTESQDKLPSDSSLAWDPWSVWSPCSNNQQTRSRRCSSGAGTSNEKCRGAGTETRTCGGFKECSDGLGSGLTDGVYNVSINIDGATMLKEVYCDMTTDGGGWTVFQYRYDGSVEFNRNFHDYDVGFGKYPGEFWLGLKWIHAMTQDKNHQLRIDMTSKKIPKFYAKYLEFKVGPSPDYVLGIGGYQPGSAKSDRMLGYNGMAFSTYDRDKDIHDTFHCAKEYEAGWWYERCAFSDLNAPYINKPDTLKHMSWDIDLTSSKMAFKPV